MRVCMIRHGLTAWNLDGRIQGGTDIPLCEEGRAQVAAWRLPDGFAATGACLTSPKLRARQTAEILGFVDPSEDARLGEMAWGSYEGRRLDELRQRLGPAFTDAESLGLDFRPPGGESPREVAARLGSLVADLAADGRDRVVIAHKGILRAALVLSTGWDMLGPPPVRYDPERALVLELESGAAPRLVAAVPLRRGAA